jgi:Helix-turn-helix domain
MNELELHQRIDTLEELLINVLNQLEAMLPAKSKVVGTGEAAQILDVCENTIRRMQKNGEMPKNIGKGKHLKYERTTIEKMAQAYKTGRPRSAA